MGGGGALATTRQRRTAPVRSLDTRSMLGASRMRVGWAEATMASGRTMSALGICNTAGKEGTPATCGTEVKHGIPVKEGMQTEKGIASSSVASHESKTQGRRNVDREAGAGGAFVWLQMCKCHSTSTATKVQMRGTATHRLGKKRTQDDATRVCRAGPAPTFCGVDTPTPRTQDACHNPQRNGQHSIGARRHLPARAPCG